jgi:hypothetical protein
MSNPPFNQKQWRADWCEYHPYVTHSALRIAPDNAFRFVPDDIPSGTGLIITRPR